MHNTLTYFKQKVDCVKAKIVQLQEAEQLTSYIKGSISLLNRLLDKANYQLLHASHLFADFIDSSCIEKPNCTSSDLEGPEWTNDDSDNEENEY